ILAWNAQNDELVPLDESEAAVRDLTAAGLRFTERLFHTADHLTLATNDEFGPGAKFLGTVRVDRDPAHVIYVVDPSEDSAAARRPPRPPDAEPQGRHDRPPARQPQLRASDQRDPRRPAGTHPHLPQSAEQLPQGPPPLRGPPHHVGHDPPRPHDHPDERPAG